MSQYSSRPRRNYPNTLSSNSGVAEAGSPQGLSPLGEVAKFYGHPTPSQIRYLHNTTKGNRTARGSRVRGRGAPAAGRLIGGADAISQRQAGFPAPVKVLPGTGKGVPLARRTPDPSRPSPYAAPLGGDFQKHGSIQDQQGNWVPDLLQAGRPDPYKKIKIDPGPPIPRGELTAPGPTNRMMPQVDGDVIPRSRLPSPSHMTQSAPELNAFGLPTSGFNVPLQDLRQPKDATDVALSGMNPLDAVPVSQGGTLTPQNADIVTNNSMYSTPEGRHRGQRFGVEPESQSDVLNRMALRRTAPLRDHVKAMEDRGLVISQEDATKQRKMNEAAAARHQYMKPGGGMTQDLMAQPGGSDSLRGSNNNMPVGSRTTIAGNAEKMEGYGLGQGPGYADRDRSTMQQGGMPDFGPVEDDGFRFAGRGATPGARFDATMFRNRQEQIDFLNKKVADHNAIADEDGVVSGSWGTRTMDTDPRSPTYGKVKVVGKPLVENSAQREERLARAAARREGSVYTDDDGSVTDYGQLNKNRDAWNERKQDREDYAQRMKTRMAQLQNYGRTGGAIVNPSGGIAGPAHVGLQPRFGPNMSRSQAANIAQNEINTEDRLKEARQRLDQKTAIDTYKDLLAAGSPQAARQVAASADLGEGFQALSDKELGDQVNRAVEMYETFQKDPEQAKHILRAVSGMPEDERAQYLRSIGVDMDTLEKLVEDNPSEGEWWPWAVENIPGAAEWFGKNDPMDTMLTGLMPEALKYLKKFGVLPPGIDPGIVQGLRDKKGDLYKTWAEKLQKQFQPGIEEDKESDQDLLKKFK